MFRGMKAKGCVHHWMAHSKLLRLLVIAELDLKARLAIIRQGRKHKTLTMIVIAHLS